MIQIISFSGLDGSGKSTQVASVTRRLEEKGHKVFYFHATHFSLPQLFKSRLKKDVRVNGEMAQTRASFLGIVLRLIILPVDLVRFEFLLRKLERQGYNYLISDRYFYDTFVNISYLAKRTSPLSFWVRRPAAAFYVNASPSMIMSRDRAPEQGIEYLEEKKVLYDKLAARNDLCIIDGDRRQQVVTSDILKRLDELGAL